MRPQPNPRLPGLLTAAGALTLLVLVISSLGSARAADGASVGISVKDQRLRYGQTLVVAGHARGAAGRQAELQYREAGGAWKVLRSTSVAPDGAYRLSARVRRSGHVRVALGSPSIARTATATATAAAAAVPVSRTRGVAIAATARATHRRLDIHSGSRALVSGVLSPGRAGRRVWLERRSGGRWHRIARARTARSGRFVLRTARVSGASSAPVRVRFAGDRLNAGTGRGLGRLNVYRSAVASWFGEGQALACGGHLTSRTLGVANKTLPCGTMVTFRYHGHRVRVPVVDRGPYGAGREWDLTPGTRRALHFPDGVDTVWSTR